MELPRQLRSQMEFGNEEIGSRRAARDGFYCRAQHRRRACAGYLLLLVAAPAKGLVQTEPSAICASRANPDADHRRVTCLYGGGYEVAGFRYTVARRSTATNDALSLPALIGHPSRVGRATVRRKGLRRLPFKPTISERGF